MRLTKMGTLIGLAVWFCLFSSAVWAGDASCYEWTKSSSVRVTKVQGGTNSCGSGTVVRKGDDGYDVITCCHVVTPDEAGVIYVKPVKGGWAKGDVRFYWKECDIAIVFVADPKAAVEATKVASKENYDTRTAFAKCGYPGAGPRHVASGYGTGLVSLDAYGWGWKSAVIGVQSRSGDSGGGLFREEDHALVGVVWGGGADGCLRATRITEIRELIDFAATRRAARKAVRKAKMTATPAR